MVGEALQKKNKKLFKLTKYFLLALPKKNCPLKGWVGKALKW